MHGLGAAVVRIALAAIRERKHKLLRVAGDERLGQHQDQARCTPCRIGREAPRAARRRRMWNIASSMFVRRLPMVTIVLNNNGHPPLRLIEKITQKRLAAQSPNLRNAHA